MVTSYGICAALLRLRDLPKNGLLESSCFEKVFSVMNSVQLDGAKTFGGNYDDAKIRVLQLEAEVEKLQNEIKLLNEQDFQSLIH